MRRFRSRDTKPEMAVRSGLHAIGLRFRIHRPVPDRPRRTIDIAFPSEKVAVFVDGCYWHGCPVHGKIPATNREWWDWKIGKNIQRDEDTTRALQHAGWTVLRCWEHEPAPEIVERVALTVRGKRRGPA